jgi:ABC-type multidrug transport system permease subunit
MSDDSLVVPVAVTTQPRFFDTYALVYAFTLTLLVPGLVWMSTLPFRTYTFQYVMAFAGPFVLGLLATFFTDSTDPWRRVALRSAIMLPLVIVTGVTVLFTWSLTVLPVSGFLRPGSTPATTPLAFAMLVTLASPLLFALVKRLRTRPGWRSLVQILALVIALGVAGFVGYLMLGTPGELRGFARKDLTIYLTGAVMWYLPSFGIAAGGWRAVGLV